MHCRVFQGIVFVFRDNRHSLIRIGKLWWSSRSHRHVWHAVSIRFPEDLAGAPIPTEPQCIEPGTTQRFIAQDQTVGLPTQQPGQRQKPLLGPSTGGRTLGGPTYGCSHGRRSPRIMRPSIAQRCYCKGRGPCQKASVRTELRQTFRIPHIQTKY